MVESVSENVFTTKNEPIFGETEFNKFGLFNGNCFHNFKFKLLFISKLFEEPLVPKKILSVNKLSYIDIFFIK